MKFMRATLLALAAMLGLAACGDGAQVGTLPAPREPGPDSVGYFCGMAVTEHRGPKGQVFLRGQPEPLWFTSVRDALAFTILPGEPRTVVALYVSDMAESADGREPLSGAWVLARDAVFVAGSMAVGGMGVREVVPFADRAAAERFQGTHGGAIYRFGEVPENFILGADGGLASAPVDPARR